MKFQLFLTKHTNHITLVTGILIVLGMLSKYLLQFTLGYQVILAVASIIAVILVWLLSRKQDLAEDADRNQRLD